MVVASPGWLFDHDEFAEVQEDCLDELFKAPFPWFGGKSRVARSVWQRFGDVKSYVEPFFGSGAVLLARPMPFECCETVNDFDGLVCNFWRSIKAEPQAVAHYADWPVIESDLHSRHIWLVERKDSLQARLEAEPNYYDAKVAGWWVWGMSVWIGSEFCSGKGPWQVQDVDGVRQLVHLSGQGQGVSRRRVHLGNGRGVSRQRVHLNSDQGVRTKREGDRAGCGEQGLLAWMEALAERFSRVRVCCGDWKRVCGGNSGDAISHFFAAGQPCGIFLDPPYADTAGRDSTIYRVDSESVAHEVREWALRHGDDKRLRIALCGYEGEHVMPSSWKCVSWKAHGGMGNLSNNRGKDNAFRERVWYSPWCL